MPEGTRPAGPHRAGSVAARPGAPARAKAAITGYALECGFDLVRVTSAREFARDRAAALERLTSGLMDGLPWFNESRVLRGAAPETLLPGARSIICLALNYFHDDEEARPAESPAGRVARYARGRDYHKVVKQRMARYVEGLRLRLGTEFAARWYVDDGPMLDRAAAARAGLGWFGKNTNILTPQLGSWVFLGQVVTDLDVEPDQPLKKTCGSCVRCIDACPTGAIVAPYVLDNARCISYLTIENRGEIPVELRPLVGDWVFGCDICQDVCPVNLKGLPSEPTLWRREGPDQPGRDLATLDLVALLDLSEEDFQRRFRGTPIMRAKRVGMQRNACVALGNRGDRRAVPALRRTLAHEEPLVRGHAAWALGRTGGAEAVRALRLAGAEEKDPGVLREIAQALEAAAGPGPGG